MIEKQAMNGAELPITTSNLVFTVGCALIGFGWLVPNHQLPWTSFHADALVGVSFLMMFLGMLNWQMATLRVPHSAVLVFVLALVPLVQLALGRVFFAGTAWMSTLYLAGLSLTIVASARSEQLNPCRLLDPFFAVLALVATASVAIQLCQWLSLYDSCYCASTFIDMRSSTRRAPANLGQPNQLATLLMWGMAAYAWGWQRRAIGGYVAIAGIAFLVIGLALTESRTGALCLLVLAGVSVFWRQLWRSARVPVSALLMVLWYVGAALVVRYLSQVMSLDAAGSVLERTQLGTRLDIWAMFSGAVWQRPWFGYGWDQTLVAQASPTTWLPTALTADGGLYAQAHNLFLDLMVWTGFPIGLTVCLACMAWLFRRLRRVSDAETALLVMCLLVIALHAMLELPLYYAYFLLPTGLLVGAIESRNPVHRVLRLPGLVVIGLWASVALLYGLVIKDYFAAEESYAELRLENNRIISNFERKPPEVVVLNQIRSAIVMARLNTLESLAPDRLLFVEHVALIYPSTPYLVKLAQALSSSGHPDEAQVWLKRLCDLTTKEQCQREMKRWQTLRSSPRGAHLVAWPTGLGFEQDGTALPSASAIGINDRVP